MLRNLRSRRRPRYGVFLCTVVSGLLLLVSVSLIGRGITSYSPMHDVNYDSLLSDSSNDEGTGGEDTIDALDVVEEPQDTTDGDDDDDEPLVEEKVSGYFFHHVEGVIRRGLIKRSMEEKEMFMGWEKDQGKSVFGSDDMVVDEKVRTKVIEVKGIEDALLLKVSPLREGWGNWFDKKSDFLRKDKILKSNLESLNPLRNPILQDPDAIGLTGITKSDKIIRSFFLHEFKRIPFSFSSRKITRDPKPSAKIRVF